MMNPPRYCPQRTFPPYAFLPGKYPHPEKPGGHMEHTSLDVTPLKGLFDPSNLDFCYAVDLFNYHYYWESHVWWEELWHSEGRKGPLADFLKALIKCAAGAVKMSLDQKTPGLAHFERALELLQTLSQSHNLICGLSVPSLALNIQDIIDGNTDWKSLHLRIATN